MTGLALATCDRPLAPGTRQGAGGAPEWVHLFPDGKMTGRDGRSFDLVDPGAVIRAFQTHAIDLAVDYEHQADRPEATLHGPVPAAGWIKELKADDTGLWGRVEWTATAAELISNREYRFISPSFLYHPQTGAISRLTGAGLVHRPNLHLKALASQESPMPAQNPATPPAKPDAPTLAGLTEALGLGPDATMADILRAVLNLLKGAGAAKDTAALMSELVPAPAPDPARFVPVETVQAMLSERNLSLATLSEARAGEKVADAMAKGYLSPAMKPWALALCRSNEASFDAFVASTVPPLAHLAQSHGHMRTSPAKGQASVVQTDEAAAVCRQLGLAPGALND